MLGKKLETMMLNSTFNSVQHLWFLCSAVYWYPGSYLISCLFNEAIYYSPDSPNQRYNTNKV